LLTTCLPRRRPVPISSSFTYIRHPRRHLTRSQHRHFLVASSTESTLSQKQQKKLEETENNSSHERSASCPRSPHRPPQRNSARCLRHRTQAIACAQRSAAPSPQPCRRCKSCPLPDSRITHQTTNTSQGIGEFLGTFLFLFFAFAGAQVANEAEAANNPDDTTTSPALGTLMYISLAFGFSLAVNAWVFFRISGGLFNPAVALGLALIGCITYTRLAVVFIAQIIGAIVSAGVVAALFPDV
jgi:hypothetical protein